MNTKELPRFRVDPFHSQVIHSALKHVQPNWMHEGRMEMCADTPCIRGVTAFIPYS